MNLSSSSINNLVGFNNEIETLPRMFDEFNTKIKLRQLFISLITPIIKENCSFSKYEQQRLANYSLQKIFEYKIKDLLPVSFIKVNKKVTAFNFDMKSTLLINNYLKRENRTNIFHYKNLLPVAKVISLCFVNNKMQLLFDVNLLFHQFVFNKIKNFHKDKYVVDSGDSICILGGDCEPVKLYTTWKFLENQKDIKEELNYAIETVKQSEFKNVYLVYPKDEDFKRHIPIRVNELEDNLYNIKVVPYSLRSTLRKLK